MKFVLTIVILIVVLTATGTAVKYWAMRRARMRGYHWVILWALKQSDGGLSRPEIYNLALVPDRYALSALRVLRKNDWSQEVGTSSRRLIESDDGEVALEKHLDEACRTAYWVVLRQLYTMAGPATVRRVAEACALPDYIVVETLDWQVRHDYVERLNAQTNEQPGARHYQILQEGIEKVLKIRALLQVE